MPFLTYQPTTHTGSHRATSLERHEVSHEGSEEHGILAMLTRFVETACIGGTSLPHHSPLVIERAHLTIEQDFIIPRDSHTGAGSPLCYAQSLCSGEPAPVWPRSVSVFVGPSDPLSQALRRSTKARLFWYHVESARKNAVWSDKATEPPVIY